MSHLWFLNVCLSAPFQNVCAYNSSFHYHVLLPRSNVKVFLPFTVDAETHTKHFTYLDTTGRYAVVLQKHNIVDEHVQNFQIEYEYPSFELYRKPLSASAAFLSLFVISAIVSKLEFKIGGKVG